MLVAQNAPEVPAGDSHRQKSTSSVKYVAHAVVGATFFNPIDFSWAPLLLEVPLDVQLVHSDGVQSGFTLSVTCNQDLIVNFSDLWLRHILYVLHRNTLSKLGRASLGQAAGASAASQRFARQEEESQSSGDASHVFELEINVTNETFEAMSWGRPT